jgi:acetyltransferase-like isoleucine patch superfamily enzyme
MPRRRLTERLLARIGTLLASLVEQNRDRIAQRTLPEFATEARNVRIELPRRIQNAHRIHMGCDVALGPNAFLAAIESYPPGSWLRANPDVEQQHFEPTITIGDRVSATSNLTVAAMLRIEIGDDVMFASNVNLTDGLHGYETVKLPYKYQPIERLAPIRIERGCWIGQNVVVLPGVTIGELSIVGANSVVAKDIPPYSIAVGAPARVTKTWDHDSEAWRPVG